MIIDTGTPRSVKGHAVSGALFALMLSSAYEYAGFKAGQKDKKLIGKNIAKATLEGGIIAASGIAAANELGSSNKSVLRSSLEALGYVSVGIAGVYALNKFMQDEPKLITRKRKANEIQAL